LPAPPLEPSAHAHPTLIDVKDRSSVTGSHAVMSAPLVSYATRTVPRYTSYPTAPHFSSAVGADTALRWLEDTPADEPLSLYLHVPFCRQMCLYCGCHTKVVRRSEPVEAYAEVLLREIGLVADALGGRRPVRHIHWGGGTPSLMPEAAFARIVEAIGTRFDLGPLREHAIELDPRTVTPRLARQLAAAGVDRASFGVQDFAPHVQAAIGRIQPPAVVAAAAEALRAAGIERIAFDLMYGLPAQSVADAVETARTALALGPVRIALFGYAHVPWFKTHQKLIDEASLPGAGERLAQADAAAAVLTGAGFVPIGLDHFALPGDPLALAAADGTLRRNFQGYTDDQAPCLIGLGVSSIGRLPAGFVQNAPDMGAYVRAIESGTLATSRGLELSADDLLRGEIIERLMCDLVVDAAAIARSHGVEPFAFEPAFEELRPLARDGLVEIEGYRLSVTERGRPFVRIAAAAFDAYLPRSAARHSRAV